MEHQQGVVQKEDASKALDAIIDGEPTEENQTSDQNKDDKVADSKGEGNPQEDNSNDKSDNKASEDSFSRILADRNKEKEDLAKKEQNDLIAKRVQEELLKAQQTPKTEEKTEDKFEEKESVEDVVRKVLNEEKEKANREREEEENLNKEVDEFISKNDEADQYKDKIIKLMKSHPTISAYAAFILASHNSASNPTNKTTTSSKPNSNLRQEKNISQMTPEEIKDRASKELDRILTNY